MDITITVLLASLVLAPLWSLFESCVRSGIQRCTQSENAVQENLKIVSAGTTACSHFLQLAMWWGIVFIAGFSPWVFDIQEWPATMMPRPFDTAECEKLAPIYAVYWGFAWHSLVKDLRRSWGNLKSPDQLSFLLHHIVTVGLTAGAFQVGCWRAGVLTRLIHDPADIFLYGSKLYQGRVGQGQGSKSVLAFLYILNCVVWFSTRVLLYGFFTAVSLTGTLRLALADTSLDSVTLYVMEALYAGSWIMLLLQVIWLGALAVATRKFFRSKGKDLKDHLDVGQPDELKKKLLIEQKP